MPEDGALEYIIRLRGGREAAADVKALEEGVRHLGGEIERVNAKTDVSTARLGRFTTALSRASAAIGPLALAGVALGPALVPVLATATAGVGALGAAFGPAAVGAGLFGSIFKSQMTAVAGASKQIQALQQKINATYGPQFATQHAAALKQMTLLQRQLNDKLGAGGADIAARFAAAGNTWQAFKQSFNPQIFKLMGVAMDAMAKLLPILHPLISATADAFIRVAKAIQAGIGGPWFKGVIDWMTQNAGSGIMAFAKIIGNLAHGFVDLLRAFQPMADGMRTGLVGLSARFANWAANLGTNSFQKFLDYVRTEGPKVGETIGKIGGALAALLPMLAAAGPSSLIILNAIAGLLKGVGGANSATGGLIGAMLPFILIAVKVGSAIFGLIGKFKQLGAFLGIGGAAAAGEEGIVAGGAAGGPIGIVLAGLAVAAILVITHWDKVKTGLTAVWNWIKTAASDTANWLVGAFTAIGKAIANAFIFYLNIPVHAINAIVDAAYKIDSLIPGGGILPGGLHVAPIPALAAGGNITRGGHALVGEHGPEVLALPTGAQVAPLAPGSMSGGPTMVVVNLDGRELLRAVARQQLMASAAGA